MLKDGETENTADDDELVDLGAVSACTRAIGNYGIEPNMEPLTWK
jgi:hypothetical protein